MKQFKLYNLLSILICIAPLSIWIKFSVGNAVFWWFVEILFLFLVWIDRRNDKIFSPIKIWLILVIVNASYGATYMAKNYWDYKNLFAHIIIYSLPFIISSTFIDIKKTNRLLCFWYRYSWILLILLLPFLESDGIGKYLSPFSFLCLFLPALNSKMRILVFIAIVLTFLLGRDSRSDLLRIIICVSMGLFFLWSWAAKHYKFFLGFGTSLFYTLPFFLVFLGITGVFNIFQLDEELGLDGDYTMSQSSGEDISIATDTRTFLYVEHFTSAVANNYVIQGRSMARGCESKLSYLYDLKGGHPDERYNSEVANLNIFNYFGLIGLICYLYIFAKASYIALTKSKNIYVPMIGCYVGFRWMFSWVEEGLSETFGFSTVLLWVMVSMCYSSDFRKMTNADFKEWIKTI